MDLIFSELEATQKMLFSLAAPYWIAGGWAIDMAVGRQTRGHKDVEIAMARDDQRFLLQLPGLVKIEYIEKSVPHIWRGERLELPVHEMYCHFDGDHTLEVLLNEFDDTGWIYRRNPAIRLPRGRFPASGGALPLEIALLFKSKHMREVDAQDFAVAAPLLDNAARRWLRAALLVEQPEHPWHDAL